MESLPEFAPESETPRQRLERQREACVLRIGRVAKEMSDAHKAQDYNIALLLDINDRIRQAEAGNGDT